MSVEGFGARLRHRAVLLGFRRLIDGCDDGVERVIPPAVLQLLQVGVRILTEGQFNLPGSHLDQLNDIDNQLVEAVESEDQGGFDQLLKQMLDLVRQKGTPVPVDELIESDLILPEPDITLKEAEELFVGEGLLPG